MRNSDTFLTIFSAIESWLRQQACSDRSASFFQLVDGVAFRNRAVTRYRDDLKEFADLRNASSTSVQMVMSSLNRTTEQSLTLSEYALHYSIHPR